MYILTKEGYVGCGVDLRRRRIWDTYGDGVDLRVETVVPSASARYDGYTWLIGNHSDELTPWIPVMAALTSRETKFFVLPCCPFRFTGKFVKSGGKSSVYQEYLEYVREVHRGYLNYVIHETS